MGCGFMGQKVHLPNFLRSPRCEVVALADVRSRMAAEVARRNGIPRSYGSHRDIAADPEVEAVAAIMNEGLHRQVAVDLLEAGKHVYLEKPIARSVAEAADMVRAAEVNGRILMIGYMKRYDTGVRRARELLARLPEELGPITLVRAHCFGGNWICGLDTDTHPTDEPAPPPPPTVPDWLPPERRRSFLDFNNVYCHNLNLVRFLVGEPEGIEYVGLGRGAHHVVLRYPGFFATFELGSLSSDRWDEDTVIYFAHGVLRLVTPPPLLANMPARIELYRATGAHERVEISGQWGWAFRNAAEHFLECVQTGAAPDSTARDSLADMALVEGIYSRVVSGAGKA